MKPAHILNELVRQGDAIEVAPQAWIFAVCQARRAGRVVSAILECGGEVTMITRDKHIPAGERYSFRTTYHIHAIMPKGVSL
jgi:hypothetical protein